MRRVQRLILGAVERRVEQRMILWAIVGGTFLRFSLRLLLRWCFCDTVLAVPLASGILRITMRENQIKVHSFGGKAGYDLPSTSVVCNNPDGKPEGTAHSTPSYRAVAVSIHRKQYISVRLWPCSCTRNSTWSERIVEGRFSKIMFNFS